MTKLDISLPDEVKALAEEQAADGGYPTLSAYLAELIRRDQQERIEQQLHEKLLLQRISSGPSTAMTDEDFDSIRARVETEIAQRRAR
jgi:antitoxin ParD1/3/4